MERPEIPGAWRLAVGAAGALCILLALVALLSGRPPPVLRGYGDPSPIALAIFSLILAFAMARRGGRDAVHALGGMAAGLVLGVAVSTFFGFFLGIGLGVPTALVASRPHRVATPLSAFGYAGLVLASATLRRVGDTPLLATNDRARGAIFALVFGALGAGLLLHAIAAQSVRKPRADVARTRKPSQLPLAAAVAGIALLVVSWMLRGTLPWLSAIALLSLALIPLIRWRAWPGGAVTTVALVALGLVPVATCELVHWDPTVGAVGSVGVRLAQVAGAGPAWLYGEDGYSRLGVACSPVLVMASAAWALALAVIAVSAARRSDGSRQAVPFRA